MNHLQFSNQIPKKKTYPKIVIAVFVLLVISGVAYGGWKTFDGEEDQPETIDATVEITPAVTDKSTESFRANPSVQQPLPILSKTAVDWKIYSDTDIGYSFKYPKDFRFEMLEESFSKKEKIALTRPADDWKRLSIFIDVQTHPTNISAREWADWYYPVFGSSKFDDTVIAGMVAIQQDLSSSTGTIGEVIFTQGNKVCRVEYVTDEVKKRNEVVKLVNQILNNFELY